MFALGRKSHKFKFQSALKTKLGSVKTHTITTVIINYKLIRNLLLKRAKAQYFTLKKSATDTSIYGIISR